MPFKSNLLRGPLLPLFDLLGVVIMQGRSLPLKWDRVKFRFYLHHKSIIKESDDLTRRNKLYLSILLGIHRTVLLILTCQIFFDSKGTLSPASKFLYWMAWIIWTVYYSYLNFAQRRCGDILTLLNELIQFAESMALYWQDKQRTMTETINILCVIFSPILMVVMAAGYVLGLHWGNPRQPTLVGYWVFGESESLQGFLLKIAVLTFNLWILLSMMLGGVVCMMCVQMLGPVLIRDCIYSFWNLEKNQGAESFQKRSEIYRQIQLLSELLNDIQAGNLMTILITVATIVFPLSFVLIVRIPWIPDNVPEIIAGTYMMFLCLTGILFVIGGHAGIWSDSQAMFENLDCLNGDRFMVLSRFERRWQQRFWKSCRNLVKIKFGVHNYVEEQTPMNCLNCSASLAVQLLLLGN